MRILFRIILLLCCVSFVGSCSEWDTTSLGKNFTPANSQVRTFTHLVYVEYSADQAKVWGPYVDEVTADIQGTHVSLKTESDSLALFVYGYTASQDSLGTSDGSLMVDNIRPFALYLNGLSLRSQEGKVITTSNSCHIVMPSGSKNSLYGSITIDGDVTFGGKGSLTVESEGSCVNADALGCQYGVNVTLRSTKGNGIDLDGGSMVSSLGTWYITAANHAINTADSILLVAGTYQGTARDGAFLNAEKGAFVGHPTLVAASAKENNVMDSLSVTLLTDTVQYTLDMELADVTLQADSTYKISRNSSTTTLTKFTPRQTLKGPFLLYSNASFYSSDTLHISK